MTETIKLADLTPDARNANKGTKRGADMINRSLGELGAGRSILVDKNGKIIAGNKTLEDCCRPLFRHRRDTTRVRNARERVQRNRK